MISVLKIL